VFPLCVWDQLAEVNSAECSKAGWFNMNTLIISSLRPPPHLQGNVELEAGLVAPPLYPPQLHHAPHHLHQLGRVGVGVNARGVLAHLAGGVEEDLGWGWVGGWVGVESVWGGGGVGSGTLKGGAAVSCELGNINYVGSQKRLAPTPQTHKASSPATNRTRRACSRVLSSADASFSLCASVNSRRPAPPSTRAVNGRHATAISRSSKRRSTASAARAARPFATAASTASAGSSRAQGSSTLGEISVESEGSGGSPSESDCSAAAAAAAAASSSSSRLLAAAGRGVAAGTAADVVVVVVIAGPLLVVVVVVGMSGAAAVRCTAAVVLPPPLLLLLLGALANPVALAAAVADGDDDEVAAAAAAAALLLVVMRLGVRLLACLVVRLLLVVDLRLLPVVVGLLALSALVRGSSP